MITCKLDIGVDLKHPLVILMASFETNSMFLVPCSLQNCILCTRSLIWILSMICKSSLGYFGLHPIRLNSHFAWDVELYYTWTLVAACEVSSHVLSRTLSQGILPFLIFEF